MPTETLDEQAVNVAAFKARCLALIDAVAEGKASRVVLTRHGRAVAALVPYDRVLPELWGALRGSVTLPQGSDLAGMDEIWKADA